MEILYKCDRCHIIADVGWSFCPYDGTELTRYTKAITLTEKLQESWNFTRQYFKFPKYLYR